MQDHWVSLENLTFCRGSRVIFDNITVKIPKGKITAIMGPSGCGKTTLLKIMGGQERPSQGRVTVGNQAILDLNREQLYQARRKMGLLFQSGALFTNLNVFENVAFPLREHTQLSNSFIRDIVLMKLQAVGLRGARDLMTNELSGGMARRVALARAIVLDPELIMYDEPFTGLDPLSMGVIVKLIKELNTTLGLTTVMVSHDVQETLSIADYVYLIAQGRVVGEGTAEQIRKDKSPWVEQFINGLPDGVVPFHYPAKDYKEDLLT